MNSQQLVEIFPIEFYSQCFSYETYDQFVKVLPHHIFVPYSNSQKLFCHLSVLTIIVLL